MRGSTALRRVAKGNGAPSSTLIPTPKATTNRATRPVNQGGNAMNTDDAVGFGGGSQPALGGVTC